MAIFKPVDLYFDKDFNHIPSLSTNTTIHRLSSGVNLIRLIAPLSNQLTKRIAFMLPTQERLPARSMRYAGTKEVTHNGETSEWRVWETPLTSVETSAVSVFSANSLAISFQEVEMVISDLFIGEYNNFSSLTTNNTTPILSQFGYVENEDVYYRWNGSSWVIDATITSEFVAIIHNVSEQTSVPVKPSVFEGQEELDITATTLFDQRLQLLEQYVIDVINSGGAGLTFQIVEELPAIGESGIIYLVPLEETTEGNIYEEFIWLMGIGYESLGTTTASVNVASQAEAEAGTNNEKLMTPLRVLQSLTFKLDALKVLKSLKHIVGDALIPETLDLNIFKIENKGEDGNQFTILEIKSPASADGSENEATITLMRQEDNESGGPEFIDFYNNGYNSSRQFGMRVQSRGTGQLRPFVFDFNNGSGVTETMRIKQDEIEFLRSMKKFSDGFNSLEFFDAAGNKTGHVGRLADRMMLFNEVSGNAIDMFDNGRTVIYQPSQNFEIFLDTGAFTVNDNEPVYRRVGTTAERPLNPQLGTYYFDTTLSEVIFWNGVEWVSATGASSSIIEQNNNTPIQIWVGTQAEYDAQTNDGANADANTMYFIEE